MLTYKHTNTNTHTPSSWLHWLSVQCWFRASAGRMTDGRSAMPSVYSALITYLTERLNDWHIVQFHRGVTLAAFSSWRCCCADIKCGISYRLTGLNDVFSIAICCWYFYCRQHVVLPDWLTDCVSTPRLLAIKLSPSISLPHPLLAHTISAEIFHCCCCGQTLHIFEQHAHITLITHSCLL